VLNNCVNDPGWLSVGDEMDLAAPLEYESSAGTVRNSSVNPPGVDAGGALRGSSGMN
jgi:hypothetical protein